MLNYKILRDHTSEILRVNIYKGSIEDVTELQGKEFEVVNMREEQSRTTYYIKVIEKSEENN